MEVDVQLSMIEQSFKKEPDSIWQYLNEDDLLLVSNRNYKFIICVKGYIYDERRVSIKFIYSLTTDTFKESDGVESVRNIDRYPYKHEIDRLKRNYEYSMYLSKRL